MSKAKPNLYKPSLVTAGIVAVERKLMFCYFTPSVT